MRRLVGIFVLGTAGSLVTGCISFQPAAGPLVAACLGECGSTVATQAIVTMAPSGPTTGCPKPACSLQLKITEDSNLCENLSVKVEVGTDAVEIWKATHTLTSDPADPGAVSSGDVLLLTGGQVKPGEVLRVKAQKLSNDRPVECKREGNLQFEITLLF